MEDLGLGSIISHNLGADPSLIDAAGLLFGLKAGSPAIDAGTPVSIVASDLAGVPRPQQDGYDIGVLDRAETMKRLYHQGMSEFWSKGETIGSASSRA